jgi:hypothetical protein
MIKKGNEEYDGEVQDPTRIVKMQVMADAIKK